MSVMYIRNKETGQFEPIKTIQGSKGDTGAVEGIEYWEGAPKANGTASPGTSDLMARGDHVHPMPTAQQVGARPNDWHPVEIFAVGSDINIVHGSINMTTSSVGEVASQQVDFGYTFAEVPIVVVNLKATSPDDRFPSYGNVTTTGMTIYGSRTSTKYVNIPVSWVAIGKRQTVVVEEV